MAVVVTGFRRTERFDADLRRAPVDVVKDVEYVLKKLIANSQSSAIRLHTIKGHPKPTVFKIDVRPDKSWQASFEMVGNEAVLLRLATHKPIDRDPR